MKWIVVIAVIWFVWRHLSRPKPVMTDEARARAVLGVGAGADADAIRAAHRARIADAHPDRGGSADLTGQLNAARDLLLRRIR